MLKTKLWWLSDGEYAEKNPPLENVRTIKGEIWYQWIDDPKWLPVGYIPRPKSVFAWFVYHFIHGVWMKYPLWAIILFCLDRDNYPNCEAVEQSVQADICPRCEGTGKFQRLGFSPTDCAVCNGTGKCR